MQRIFICLMLAFNLSILHADTTANPDSPPTTESEEQDSCYEQRYEMCMNKCQDTDIENCKKLCAENVQNECREAGV